MDNNINNLEEQLLKAFIGNNYEKIVQKKFSVPALFLSWIYTLYRKIYLPSIIGMIAIILLGFLPSIVYYIIVFAFVIILGINFNKWYVEYAKKQVSKIKMNNQNASENELINICMKKGGTNIGTAILIYVVFAIVSGFLNPNISQLYNSNNDVDNNNNTDTNNNCSLQVENANMFLKQIDELSLNCKEYEVKYNNLKYVVKKTYDEEYGGNYNIEKIYYMDNELKYITDNKKEYAHLGESYLLENSNDNNDFLLIFNELPVRQIPKKYIIVFNENGNIKLLDTTTSDILYDEEKQELSFSVKTEEFNQLNFLTCDVIKNYDKTLVYSKNYTYKYDNGEMNLIKTEDITIEKLQQEYNCN